MDSVQDLSSEGLGQESSCCCLLDLYPRSVFLPCPHGCSQHHRPPPARAWAPPDSVPLHVTAFSVHLMVSIMHRHRVACPQSGSEDEVAPCLESPARCFRLGRVPLFLPAVPSLTPALPHSSHVVVGAASRAFPACLRALLSSPSWEQRACSSSPLPLLLSLRPPAVDLRGPRPVMLFCLRVSSTESLRARQHHMCQALIRP